MVKFEYKNSFYAVLRKFHFKSTEKDIAVLPTTKWSLLYSANNNNYLHTRLLDHNKQKSCSSKMLVYLPNNLTRQKTKWTAMQITLSWMTLNPQTDPMDIQIVSYTVILHLQRNIFNIINNEIHCQWNERYGISRRQKVNEMSQEASPCWKCLSI